MQKAILLTALILLSFTLNLIGQKTATKYFVSDHIFKSNYFIENKGQFVDPTFDKQPIKFAVDNQGDHIYFNPAGFSWQLSEVKKGEKNNSMQKEENIQITNEYIYMKWLQSNSNCNIETVSKSKHYFTYGEEKYSSYGYEKIIYKNLYPSIDVEYIIPKQHGVKYSLILHPGATLHDVYLNYFGKNVSIRQKGNKIIIKNAIGQLQETGIKAYYENGKTIGCRFRMIDQKIGFEFLVPIDSSKKIIIDPYIKQITSLTAGSNGTNKGYDVDYDYQGNLYVYGGGGFSENTKVAQYSSTGNLIWTFNGSLVSPAWSSQGEFGHIGNFGVEKLNGKTYIGQGLNNSTGVSIVRLNINGVYDSFISNANPNFTEMWEMNFDCNTGNILGMGGGTGSNINMAVINSNGGFSSSNIAGLSSPSQDILSSTITSTGEAFVGMVSSSGTPSLDNTLIKLNATLNGNVWIVPSGFTTFYEASNKLYSIGASISNGFNALHANSNYLYYYNGRHIKAFNKNTGAAVGNADSIFGHSVKTQGGIYADECDNIYLGGNNGNILVFHFDGTNFIPLPEIYFLGMGGKHIYDIKYNGGNGLLYACGESMVATVKRNQTCFDTTTSMIPILNVNCNSATLSIANGDTSSIYSFLWTNNTNNTSVQTKLNTTDFADTLNTIITGNVYTVVVVKDSLCGGVSEAITFTAPGNIPIATNYLICNGESLIVNGNTYTSTGIYQDTFLTASGCDSFVVSNLTVSQNSSFTQNFDICYGEQVVVNGHVYTISGNYKDTLINSKGCDSVIFTNLNVSFNSNNSQKFKICFGHSITVNNHIYSKSGVYKDTFQSAIGCDSIVTTTLEVGQSSEGDFFIPNVFTPNNDGLNDCFSISNKKDLLELQFIIYNRWGEAVFTTNQTWDCWNGNYKGGASENGVYYYYIKAKTSCGEAEYTGDVTLMR